jgi:hypothetical protein
VRKGMLAFFHRISAMMRARTGVSCRDSRRSASAEVGPPQYDGPAQQWVIMYHGLAMTFWLPQVEAALVQVT